MNILTYEDIRIRIDKECIVYLHVDEGPEVARVNIDAM